MKIPTPKQVRTTVARNIVAWRTASGMSQQTLADKAGVDRKTINRIEKGHFSPSLDTLARLAKAQRKHPTQYLTVKVNKGGK